ncbi:DUF1573 domain-containing protein [Bacteroidales bacterium OttesenSCG-928-C19]|nr:DUF1573 domain-containing protein [Bacteroidales bacterium OttesenSCG-928-C19]
MRKILILILVCIGFFSCGKKTQQDAISTDLIEIPTSHSGTSKSKMPVITFEKNMHDFGRLTPGENISYSFKFTNTGDADLIITSCDATCGCTVADFPKGIIKPKETGYITVTFSTRGRRGQQHQSVTVIANTQPSTTKLSIRAQIES